MINYKHFTCFGKNIFLSTSVIDLIGQFKQAYSKQTESGGVLLGQIKDNNYYIIKASIPTKFDKKGRIKFVRDKDIAQIIVDYEFYNSSGSVIYMGEWHTHPENHPSPSSIDINMLKDQYNANITNSKYLVLIIQGIESLFLCVYDGKHFENFKIM